MIIIVIVIVSWLSGLWSCEAGRKDLTDEERLNIRDYVNSVSVLVQKSNKVSYKFFNLPGIYYKRAQYPEALKRFEDALEVLGNLDMTDDPITETLKENIEFIKKSLEKKNSKLSEK